MVKFVRSHLKHKSFEIEIFLFKLFKWLLSFIGFMQNQLFSFYCPLQKPGQSPPQLRKMYTNFLRKNEKYPTVHIPALKLIPIYTIQLKDISKYISKVWNDLLYKKRNAYKPLQTNIFSLWIWIVISELLIQVVLVITAGKKHLKCILIFNTSTQSSLIRLAKLASSSFYSSTTSKY